MYIIKHTEETLRNPSSRAFSGFGEGVAQWLSAYLGFIPSITKKRRGRSDVVGPLQLKWGIHLGPIATDSWEAGPPPSMGSSPVPGGQAQSSGLQNLPSPEASFLGSCPWQLAQGDCPTALPSLRRGGGAIRVGQ
jgi:hypothetical protein